MAGLNPVKCRLPTGTPQCGSVPVSVLIPAKNEQDNIGDCVRSVAWSDDVVVVDSRSTDETCLRASRLGARIVQFEYTPGGLKKKNWALKNVDFKYEWILILDADERVTPPLAAEIAQVVCQPSNPCVGYYINRRFYFLGRWIRHAGYWPSWNLRLLRRGFGEYEFVPDPSPQGGDNEVHEHVILRGPAGWLRECIEHYAYPDVRTFVEKHCRYAAWEARVSDSYLLGNGVTHLPWALRARRFAKRIARKTPFADLWRFVYHYILKGGFLDGAAGYVFCRLLAEYEFLILAHTIERRMHLASEPRPNRVGNEGPR